MKFLVFFFFNVVGHSEDTYACGPLFVFPNGTLIFVKLRESDGVATYYSPDSVPKVSLVIVFEVSFKMIRGREPWPFARNSLSNMERSSRKLEALYVFPKKLIIPAVQLAKNRRCQVLDL